MKQSIHTMAPISRQCMKVRLPRLYNLKCSCFNRNISTTPCDLWSIMTPKEKNDVAVMFRVSHHGEGEGVEKVKGDDDRFKEILEEYYKDYDYITIEAKDRETLEIDFENKLIELHKDGWNLYGEVEYRCNDNPGIYRLGHWYTFHVSKIKII